MHPLLSWQSRGLNVAYGSAQVQAAQRSSRLYLQWLGLRLINMLQVLASAMLQKLVA